MVFDDLHGMSNADKGLMKQIITSSTDHYRASYGEISQDWDRHNIFAATTNEHQYLGDPTGQRRFLPIVCNEINLDYVQANREQIWAEAYVRYRAGETWWEIPFADIEQEKRYDVDPWEEGVIALLEEMEKRVRGMRQSSESTWPYCEITVNYILFDHLKFAQKDVKRDDRTRVREILSRLGYKEMTESAKGKRLPRRYWRRRLDTS